MNMKQYICLLFVLLFANTCFSQADVRPFLEKGNGFYAKGEYRNAAVQYKHACQLDSASFDAWYNFGNALCEMQKYVLASEAYNKAMSLTSDKNRKADILHNTGNIAYNQENYEKAVALYKQSLLLNPKADDTRVNLALAQQMLKKKKDNEDSKKEKNKEEKPKPSAFAEECFKKAMELVAQAKFEEALTVMTEAKQKDKSVGVYDDFTHKLSDVVTVILSNSSK